MYFLYKLHGQRNDTENSFLIFHSIFLPTKRRDIILCQEGTGLLPMTSQKWQVYIFFGFFLGIVCLLKHIGLVSTVIAFFSFSSSLFFTVLFHSLLCPVSFFVTSFLVFSFRRILVNQIFLIVSLNISKGRFGIFQIVIPWFYKRLFVKFICILKSLSTNFTFCNSSLGLVIQVLVSSTYSVVSYRLLLFCLLLLLYDEIKG